MRRDLPTIELERFLSQPLVAILATYRKDGTILLSPVWHEWADGGFNVMIGPDDVKARHLRRDPRVSLVVAQSEPPYAGAEIRTIARLIEDDEAAHGLDRRLAVRYLGERMGNEYADSIADDPMIVLRLESGTFRSWDYSDTPELRTELPNDS